MRYFIYDENGLYQGAMDKEEAEKLLEENEDWTMVPAKRKKIMVTGHRIPGLYEIPSRNAYSKEKVQTVNKFAYLVVKQLKKQELNFVMLVGMAVGWDQAIAEACVQLDVPFIAYVPYRTYSEIWPHDVKVRYEFLLAHAEEIIVVSESTAFSAILLQNRNVAMVKDCHEVLAVWNGQPSGTGHAIRYAKGLAKPIENVWEQWVEFRDQTL